MGENRAEIGERCIGCGRCAPMCPLGAIELQLDPEVDWLQALMLRISARTKIDSD